MIVRKTLEQTIIEAIDVPVLPPVAAKVLSLLEDEDAHVQELEDIISKDPSFTARVLQIANSPFYNPNREVRSVSAAIMMIGFKTMISLALAAALKGISRKATHADRLLWEHNVGVSIASSLLARETNLARPDEVFPCGLVHDLGKTIISSNLPDAFREIERRMQDTEGSLLDIEESILGFNHSSVGGFVARKWKLPKNLQVVIEYHHTDLYPNYEDSAYESLCQIVKIADLMCMTCGIGYKRPVDASRVGFREIGLSQRKYEELLERLMKSYSEEREKLLALS